MVGNASVLPIYDVEFRFCERTEDTNASAWRFLGGIGRIPLLPPSAGAAAVEQVPADYVRRGAWQNLAVEIGFRDAANREWTRMADGRLIRRHSTGGSIGTASEVSKRT